MFPSLGALCRCGCGEKLQGRQRSWRKGHERKCVEAYRIARGQSGAIRSALGRRDHGVCAGCGLDTREAVAECRRWIHGEGPAADQERAEVAELRRRFMLLGFPSPSIGRGGIDRWWNADHIVPLEEGGQNALENLRTLCLRCHRRATAEHAARRAERKRARSMGDVTFLPLV